MFYSKSTFHFQETERFPDQDLENHGPRSGPLASSDHDRHGRKSARREEVIDDRNGGRRESRN
jgi:hypothetical protein